MNAARITLFFTLLVAAACGGEAEEGGAAGGETCGPLLTEVGGWFTFTLLGANGEIPECDFELEQQLVIEGAIRGSLEQGWVIDSCPPGADCAPLESMITVAADELEITIPEGAFVRATVTTEFEGVPGMGGDCHSYLAIENLPVWSGLPNPVPTAPGVSELALWLAGHAGSYARDPVDDLTVTPEAVCRLEKSSSDTVFYDLRFESASAPGSAVSVPLGQTAAWVVPKGPMAGAYRARNLSARSEECCHGAASYAYWVARAPAP